MRVLRRASVEAVAALRLLQAADEGRDRGVRGRDRAGSPSAATRSRASCIGAAPRELGGADRRRRSRRPGLEGELPGRPDRQRVQGRARCSSSRCAPRSREAAPQARVVACRDGAGRRQPAARRAGVRPRAISSTRRSSRALIDGADRARRLSLDLGDGAPVAPRSRRGRRSRRAVAGDPHGRGGVRERTPLARRRPSASATKKAAAKTSPAPRSSTRPPIGGDLRPRAARLRPAAASSGRPRGHRHERPSSPRRARAALRCPLAQRRSFALGRAEHDRVAALGQQREPSSGVAGWTSPAGLVQRARAPAASGRRSPRPPSQRLGVSAATGARCRIAVSSSQVLGRSGPAQASSRWRRCLAVARSRASSSPAPRARSTARARRDRARAAPRSRSAHALREDQRCAVPAAPPAARCRARCRQRGASRRPARRPSRGRRSCSRSAPAMPTPNRMLPSGVCFADGR